LSDRNEFIKDIDSMDSAIGSLSVTAGFYRIEK